MAEPQQPQKLVLEREVHKVTYSVEAEMLPSGAASYTFRPPLPGRAPVIHVDEEIVADMVRMVSADVDYDHEQGAYFVTLECVDAETGVFPNEEEPDFAVAMECVGNDVVLEAVLDGWLLDACSDCGRVCQGDDVWPSLPDGTSGAPPPKKPTLMN